VPLKKLAFELNTTPWLSGWRLAVIFSATIVVATATSLVYELWLQKVIWDHYGWLYDEPLAQNLSDVLEANVITGIAIIGPAILLFRSVARLTRANENLQTALHVAQSASVAKSQFLANMSHELRTPLNAVIGFADLMGTEPFGPLLPRYKGYAADIRKAGLHLLDVINDVLDISKAEAVEFSVRMSDVDLGEIFSEVETLAAGLASDASIALSFEITANSGPVMVSADRIRLKQALLNLVSNGIKFNNTGGSVTVRAFVEAGTVRIEIQDTGIGMKPGEITAAFQPFIQLHSGHSRKYEGTGLGLPLTKIFIEAMKGSIAVHSAVGVGSRITITLSGGASNDVARAA
jgi:two-component system, cell cycle sensor histidine kinase PleC